MNVTTAVIDYVTAGVAVAREEVEATLSETFPERLVESTVTTLIRRGSLVVREEDGKLALADEDTLEAQAKEREQRKAERDHPPRAADVRPPPNTPEYTSLIRQDIVRVLRDAGRPMRAADIHRELAVATGESNCYHILSRMAAERLLLKAMKLYALPGMEFPRSAIPRESAEIEATPTVPALDVAAAKAEVLAESPPKRTLADVVAKHVAEPVQLSTSSAVATIGDVVVTVRGVHPDLAAKMLAAALGAM